MGVVVFGDFDECWRESARSLKTKRRVDVTVPAPTHQLLHRKNIPKQDALVRQAGGYMLETLPEATEETEKTVINNVAKLLSRVSCLVSSTTYGVDGKASCYRELLTFPIVGTAVF